MIKNVIFDMGNVLLDYNPNVILNKVCKSEADKDIIRRELFEASEWIERDMGTLTREEQFECVSRRVPESLQEQLCDCLEHWDICMIPLPGAWEFYHYVKKRGCKTFVLSNAASDFYSYFPKSFKLEQFDGVVVSCDVHMLKPDLQIYRYMLDKYSLKAEECLFIDDRQDNVAGAIKAGMQAVVFKGDFESIKEMFWNAYQPPV